VETLLSQVTPAAAAVTFAVLLLLEGGWPLRPRVEDRWRRLARNLALFGTSAVSVAALNAVFLTALVAHIENAGVGLLPWVGLRQPLRTALGVILLDYTLWHWHRWNHLVPFLWRFHAVHHSDRDLDVATGPRFHYGEMTLSVGYRALQVVLIGADAATVMVWQALLIPSILFHHSNLRLPAGLDRALAVVIVTPRMHGIHHSNVREENNSNWSSLVTLWDRLHGTLRLDVPQEAITIGVPAYDRPEAVTVGRILFEPFRRQPDYWQGRLSR